VAAGETLAPAGMHSSPEPYNWQTCKQLLCTTSCWHSCSERVLCWQPSAKLNQSSMWGAARLIP
jgi:hypothetical protein